MRIPQTSLCNGLQVRADPRYENQTTQSSPKRLPYKSHLAGQDKKLLRSSGSKLDKTILPNTCIALGYFKRPAASSFIIIFSGQELGSETTEFKFLNSPWILLNGKGKIVQKNSNTLRAQEEEKRRSKKRESQIKGQSLTDLEDHENSKKRGGEESQLAERLASYGKSTGSVLERGPRLFSVDGIGDTEIIFGEMRPRTHHRLPDICLMVGENLEKTQPGNQPKRESNPRPNATPDRQASALADRATPVAP
ncbi:hypothetical protein ANN_10377 [Periplaneta americana]|uniref:Uncharacterized protein n=1 Tax=Periplaneta americana TaxID=6978 RepID=A0ABQ8TNU0_PERAM|nr:hypothetical protein ANN_10377 [Periplaneta americana]